MIVSLVQITTLVIDESGQGTFTNDLLTPSAPLI